MSSYFTVMCLLRQDFGGPMEGQVHRPSEALAEEGEILIHRLLKVFEDNSLELDLSFV